MADTPDEIQLNPQSFEDQSKQRAQLLQSHEEQRYTENLIHDEKW